MYFRHKMSNRKSVTEVSVVTHRVYCRHKMSKMSNRKSVTEVSIVSHGLFCRNKMSNHKTATLSSP